MSRFPQATKAMLRGYSEAKNMCVRYNSGISYVQNCGSDDAVAAAYMSNTGMLWCPLALSSYVLGV